MQIFLCGILEGIRRENSLRVVAAETKVNPGHEPEVYIRGL